MRRQGDFRVRRNGFGKGVPRIGEGIFQCGWNQYCADLSIAGDLDKEGILIHPRETHAGNQDPVSQAQNGDRRNRLSGLPMNGGWVG